MEFCAADRVSEGGEDGAWLAWKNNYRTSSYSWKGRGTRRPINDARICKAVTPAQLKGAYEQMQRWQR